MPEYSYRTKSRKCEAAPGTEVTPENCNGCFNVTKSIKKASDPEQCRFCNCELIKDLKSQGAPGIEFRGSGFYVNKSRNS